MRWRGRRAAAALALAVGFAAMLTATGTRLAASQGTALTALQTDSPPPARDPWSSFWDKVPATQVALSAQQVTPPMGGRRWTLQARAVQDGTNLFVLLQWPDSSPQRSVGAPQLFTDAAAVMFPAGGGTQVPAFCMGDPSATVNIWQWKAAWQADVHRGFQGAISKQYPNAESDWYPFHGDEVFYPGRYVGNPFSQTNRSSSVDDLVAAGYGTLTADPNTHVQGWGAWKDGSWRVVFERPLHIGREGNVDFGTVDYTDIAFAVWDGAAQERDGMKSVGSFTALHISAQPMGSVARFPFWPAPYFVLIGLWGFFVWRIAFHDSPRSEPKREPVTRS